MSTFQQQLGQHALPGMGPIITADAVEIRTDPLHFVTRGVRLDSAIDDPRTPALSGLLKEGLVLTRAEGGGAVGKYVEFTHADHPGTGLEEKSGILLFPVDLNKRGSPGVFEDKVADLLIHGFVDEALIEFDNVSAPQIVIIKATMPLVQFEDLP